MAGIAIVFPGQGSQKAGMGLPWVDTSAAIFDVVMESTGVDVRRLCCEADDDELRKTENTQIALFTTSIAAYRSLSERAELKPLAMAGHSVGEYAALTAAGILDVGGAARLVRRRGELMSRAGALRPGTMAAVIGMEDDVVRSVCERVSSATTVVVVANSNSPGQVVISGDVAAVEAASSALKEAGAKRVIPLSVSGAFHSPLMTDAAEAMGRALVEVEFRDADVPVVSNVTATVGENWRALLEQQLTAEVKWTDSVRHMRAMGCDTFLECGSGEVLTGLLKRIDPEASGLAVGSPEAIDKFLAVSA